MDKKIFAELLDYDPVSGVITWTKANHNNARKGMVAGTRLSNRYIRIYVYGKPYQAHRVAWLLYYGDWPTHSIDHIDGDKHNNSIQNLRCVSHQENCKNTSLSRSSVSGVTGVTWMKNTKRWRARVCVDGKDIHLGFFREKSDAIIARKQANIKYGFHENHGKHKTNLSLYSA